MAKQVSAEKAIREPSPRGFSRFANRELSQPIEVDRPQGSEIGARGGSLDSLPRV